MFQTLSLWSGFRLWQTLLSLKGKIKLWTKHFNRKTRNCNATINNSMFLKKICCFEGHPVIYMEWLMIFQHSCWADLKDRRLCGNTNFKKHSAPHQMLRSTARFHLSCTLAKLNQNKYQRKYCTGHKTPSICALSICCFTRRCVSLLLLLSAASVESAARRGVPDVL